MKVLTTYATAALEPFDGSALPLIAPFQPEAPKFKVALHAGKGQAPGSTIFE